jgi:HEAT repeat protein
MVLRTLRWSVAATALIASLGTAAAAQDAADLKRAIAFIDDGSFEKALAELDRFIGQFDRGGRNGQVDAAFYWKAYTLSKYGQRADALATLAEMEKKFAGSRWLRDAKALEVEVRQASGQAVSPEAQADEEIKLLALRGLMHSDPDRALPMIQQILAGTGPVRVKENALFLLSQSRSPRAREIITGAARNNAAPQLQVRAIRYLGAIGGADSRQVLQEVYKAGDESVKRSILRSYTAAGDLDRLAAVARTETSPELRTEAVRQLGALGADDALADLYASESSVDVKRRILQAMFVSGNSAKLLELAKSEKDNDLRRAAVRNLGIMSRDKTGEALRSIYTTDSDPDVRREAINALFVQQNATTLVALARAEKDPGMKRAIVSKLSVMKSREATDYMLELLK